MAYRNKKTVYAAAAILLLLMVLVLLPSLTLKSKGVLRSTLSPAERGVSGFWQRLAEAGAAIRGIGGAVEENRDLTHELVRIQAELNSLRDAEEDNARLRRALEFRRIQPFAMIPCDVVSRNISGWWSSVRIGKGKRDHIEPDHAVISPDGLVGKTAEVNTFTSEVLLLSDPACRVSAKIARLNVYGLVRGNGSNLKGQSRARMDFINKDRVIRVGDEVVTSGLSTTGGVFPKGVHIGYVEKVTVDDSGLFQSADIVPSATAGLLDYVFVISSQETEATE